MNKLLAVLRQSAKPATIFYPYPVLVLIVFSMSGTNDYVALVKAVLFSFLFYSGVNLWNHINDVKEDIMAGKRNVLTENPEIRKILTFSVPAQYIASLALVFIWVKDFAGIVAFLLAFFVTWVYSDRIFLGRFMKRWKDNYITELLAFVTFFPSFTLVIWTFFVPISLTGIALSVTMTFFLLSGTFLKDIRDISGDSKAGLKTLGVVFKTETLMKASFSMLILFYLSISLFTVLGLFPKIILSSLLFSMGVLYTIKKFIDNHWKISAELIGIFRVLFYSNIGSLLSFLAAGVR